MKLLSGENLAQRLVDALADLYPGSAHVLSLGLGGARDRAIWARAGGEEMVYQYTKPFPRDRFTSRARSCHPHGLLLLSKRGLVLISAAAECHMHADWLLIYRVLRHRVVLHRTGTHRDLFRARRRG